MRLQTLLDVKVNDAVEYFPELKISLEKDGLKVVAKSPIFAEFFSRQPGTVHTPTKGPWAGIPIRLPKSGFRELLADPGNGLFSHDIDNGEMRANLLWLYSPALGEGLTLVIKHPIGLNDLEHYFTSACEQLQNLYVNQVRTREFQAVLREVFESGPVQK